SDLEVLSCRFLGLGLPFCLLHYHGLLIIRVSALVLHWPFCLITRRAHYTGTEVPHVLTDSVPSTFQMMQVWSNHRNGHTGQLSAITSGLLFFGALARIFTSVTETGDALMVGTFMIAAVANFCIFAQVLYYWDVTNKRVQDKKK
ncbi:mannose-P-dolichol utilization defect 1 protein, putative, partial [Ixodes scapularis]